MIRADNRAYDYSKYEYLEQLKQESIQQEQPNPRPAQKPKSLAKPKMHLFSIIFIFSVSVLIISRYAFIAEINFKINSLEKDYLKAVKENTELNVQLMRSVNLESLEKVAIEELNMQYPDVQSQIVYVNIQQNNGSDEAQNSAFYSISDVQENRYIAYTKTVIGNILKVLD